MEEAPSDRVLTETTHAPHNAVKAESLSVFLGSRCLLANTELKIAERPRNGTSYGLVGCNGCGKSTLLRLMAQRKLPVPETWDVFLLGQHLLPGNDLPAIEEVLNACPKRSGLLAEAKRLAALLEAEPGPEPPLLGELSEALSKVHADLAEWQRAPSEVLDILRNLGFQESEALDSCPAASTPVKQLSGGWRMKVELAKALWLRPKLLLLDEPTNHLDFRAREWLIEQIAEYPHTAVVVSHDVAFLHEVCKDIIWMTEQRLETLPGKIVSQEDLLRMQRRKPLRFEFRVPSGEDPVSQGISLHDVEFTYRDGAGLSVESLRLSGRSRVVLLGRNGGGKSTFLKLCAGRLEPGQGSVDRTPGLKVGYFSQVTEEMDANSQLTAAEFLLEQCREELAEHTGSTHTSRLTTSKKASDSSGASVTKPKASKSVCEKRLLEVARGVLSNHGLDGDLATKVSVDALSGGQKACLKLAVLSQSPAHILLLDEPTNHLDAEACCALAEALAKYPGGIVAVTHDPLLTYRLIHCNWNSSELLLCRDGFLWKQRNFSSHSLKAFQESLQRDEAEARPTKKTKDTPKRSAAAKPTAKASGTPPWLQGTRRSSKGRAAAENPVPHVPPWLARPRGDRERQDASVALGATPVSAATSQPVLPRPTAAPAPEITGAAERPVGRSLRPDTDIPDTWEELETSSVSTEAPSSEEDSRARSRLHKDLQNLNKAVAKWQRHGEKDIVERIRSSKAALRLREREDFDEDRFLQSVLSRSGRERNGDP